ncbi:hypothetical protein [Poritiphilus flavus]|uniref:Uncharacterized protein n=1 Tax=Poritiphilus flavus TaxID=2697053 RepID=A0A6L9EI23_9FLAO|nr:hypothetical protein [Poritiphilus flavus]NAS14333.1 hypothetical protein [Poritiphilus flavus]
MNIRTERKIRFWLSTLAKVLIIALVIFKLIPYLTKNFGATNPEELLKASQDTLSTPTPIEGQHEKAVMPEEKPADEQPDTQPDNFVKEKADITSATPAANEIVEILQFKGKPLAGAYFTIKQCNECTSTVSGPDGKTRALIPQSLLDSNREYDFYVFVADTLLYHRSMRFSNLQFNTY